MGFCQLCSMYLAARVAAAVAKHPLCPAPPPLHPPQAKECMLFAGTAVSSGSGIGVVTSIGMQTEIGKIQSQIAAASEEEEDTPLKQKLDEFGELLAKVRVLKNTNLNIVQRQ